MSNLEEYFKNRYPLGSVFWQGFLFLSMLILGCIAFNITGFNHDGIIMISIALGIVALSALFNYSLLRFVNFFRRFYARINLASWCGFLIFALALFAFYS